MSGRSRWLLRLLRLLAVCVAFVVARPAAATPAVDRIVLVAEMTAAGAVSIPGDARAASTAARTTRRDTRTSARGTADIETPSGVRARGATPQPLVIVPKKYLRHCSLLR